MAGAAGWWRGAAHPCQIITGTVCHLEAGMVRSSMDECNLSKLDILFIENLGNLVCPAS